MIFIAVGARSKSLSRLDSGIFCVRISMYDRLGTLGMELYREPTVITDSQIRSVYELVV